MFGINTLFNAPLAIDKGYLLSLIPTLLMEFSLNKNNKIKDHSFLSEAKDVFKNKIKTQVIAGDGNAVPVVLDICGPIIKYSTWFSFGTQFYCDILKSLDANPSISGIVLNIDSGGGMVSGTAELTEVIKNMKTPTISYTNGYQCSAALDIASGCDYHMASPQADLIGSIGTMLSYQDFSALFEKYGAKIYELYAPQSTEKNLEFRELMAGNETLYTERLRVLAQDFIDRMKENFGETLKDDGHIFKGKTYTPQEALAVGLIDELGTMEDVLQKF